MTEKSPAAKWPRRIYLIRIRRIRAGKMAPAFGWKGNSPTCLPATACAPHLDAMIGDPDRTDAVEKNQGLAFPRGLNRPFENKGEFSAFPNLPVAGSTGLCNESSEAIGQAAAWLAANRETAEKPIIPNLRKRFGLTPYEAVSAIRKASAI